MPEAEEEKSTRVAALAHRLRLVQSDFADAAPEARQRYLGDEIERALTSVVPAEREAFLLELAARFPAWDGNAAAVPATSAAASVEKKSASAAPAAAPAATDAREMQDPSFFVERLCKLAAGLDEHAKEAIQSKLRQAGALPAAAQLPWDETLVRELRGKLGLADQKKLDPPRIAELTNLLAEFAANLHQLVGVAWRTIAPTADVKHRPGSLQNTMARFVGGEQTVSRQQVAQELERLRQLVASLIAGVGEVGRQFARDYNSRFSPTEIKSAADNERAGLLVSSEVKCWRKYVELWDTLDEAAIEKEIRDTIAKFAETVMKGVAR